MGVTNAQLLDLVRTTLPDLPSQEYEVMWDTQNLEFPRIYSEKSVRVDGGTSIQRNVVLDRTGRARYRKLFDTDAPAVPQIQHEINVPWTQVGTNYSWDVVEIRRQMNSTKGYIDLLKSRRMEGFWDLAELLDEKGWITPLSATDTTNPYGIPYFLNKLQAGETDLGFEGKTVEYQDGSTGTIVAGIDGGVEKKWRNLAGTYTKIDNAFLRTMRRAFLKGNFVRPAMIPNPGNSSSAPDGPMAQLYAPEDVVIEAQDLADKRDDNTAPDDLFGKMLVNNPSGMVTFNRRPMTYIPRLDSDVDQPIYFIDWSKIQPIVHDGYWMEETEPMSDRGQHTTLTIYIDGSHQNLCINRRTAGFVLHKAR